MAYAKYTFSELGADPTSLYAANSNSIPQPQFRLGTTVFGDGGGEWVFCQLTLGSTTSLLNGQAYVIDRNFLATALTTANSPRGASVGWSRISQANTVAGTYYLWLQVNGHCPAQYTGNATAIGETTATGGLVNFNNTPTATTKAVVGAASYVANQTFTADALINTNVLSNVSSFNDVAVGATVAGTGIPASTTIVSFGPGLTGVNQIVMSANATATNAGITVTQTGVITINLTRPYIGVTN